MPLRFNLSHTRELAAVVVTVDDDCGVDVEPGVTTRADVIPAPRPADAGLGTITGEVEGLSEGDTAFLQLVAADPTTNIPTQTVILDAAAELYPARERFEAHQRSGHFRFEGAWRGFVLSELVK